MPSNLTKGDIVDLSKEWILSRISQEEAFEHYMGRSLNLSSRFCSPLRSDKHPTCTMAYFSGKLFFRDWSMPNAMDVFNFVQTKYKISYQEALRQIATDFELWEVEPTLMPTYLLDQGESLKSRKREIAVKIQPFTGEDLEFLKSYHLTSAQTTKFKVFSLKYAWLQTKTYYIHQTGDPALGYYFGTDEHKSQRWKIYFYKRRDHRPRFLGNTNRIAGWIQLPEKGELVVLTKSLKDVMVLDLFGVPAISMQSESTFPYPEIIDELQERFSKVVSLYDFDYAGISGACRLRRVYGIEPLFLTNGRFNTVDFAAKDISDYIRENGIEATEALIRTTVEKLGLKPDMTWSWNQF